MTLCVRGSDPITVIIVLAVDRPGVRRTTGRYLQKSRSNGRYVHNTQRTQRERSSCRQKCWPPDHIRRVCVGLAPESARSEPICALYSGSLSTRSGQNEGLAILNQYSDYFCFIGVMHFSNQTIHNVRTSKMLHILLLKASA